MVTKVRCPKCGQMVVETAINTTKGNCYYCSGMRTTLDSVKEAIHNQEISNAEEEE